MRDGIASLADGIDFAPDALRARAVDELGLADFGSDTYGAPLAALAAAIDSSRLTSPVGRFMLHAQLLQLLKNRLLLADLLTRHSEIHAIELAPPIIICGLPRTGTTHLHNLMAADPALRSLPYWESLEPIPSPAEAGMEVANFSGAAGCFTDSKTEEVFFSCACSIASRIGATT